MPSVGITRHRLRRFHRKSSPERPQNTVMPIAGSRVKSFPIFDDATKQNDLTNERTSGDSPMTKQALVALVMGSDSDLPKLENATGPTDPPNAKRSRRKWAEAFSFIWSTRPDSNWRPSRWQGDAGVDFIEVFRLRRSYRCVSVNSGGSHYSLHQPVRPTRQNHGS